MTTTAKNGDLEVEQLITILSECDYETVPTQTFFELPRIPNRQNDLNTGPLCSRRAHVNAAVVGHDDLLDQRQAQASTSPLRRKKWLKDSFAQLCGNSRPVIVERHLHVSALDTAIDQNLWNSRCVDARFESVPHNVAERLAQQHVISFNTWKLSADRYFAAPS